MARPFFCPAKLANPVGGKIGGGKYWGHQGKIGATHQGKIGATHLSTVDLRFAKAGKKGNLTRCNPKSALHRLHR